MEPVTVGEATASPAQDALMHSVPENASANQAELDAKIDAELGLPAQPAAEPTEPVTEPEKTEPEPTEPTEPEVTELTEPEAPKVPEGALTIDVEGADGKTYKISSLEDLPEDYKFKSDKHLAQVLAQLGDLREQEKEQAAAAEAEQVKQAEEASRVALVTSWDNEIAALQGEGRIGKPAVAFGTPTFDNDPAVKRVAAVYKYMTEENGRRTQAGTEPIRSFTDALNALELQELKAEKVEREKAETTRAKAKSGMIGRTSSSGTDTPVYVAGSAQSMDDL